MPTALKRRPALSVAQDHGDHSVYLHLAEIVEEDIEWLKSVECLTLWNVTIPCGFLARLKRLWWLDIRGGSGTNLETVRGANNLRYLAVNQVRGMRDVAIAGELPSLEYLDLYGLPQLTNLPSFANSRLLERANLGQLRGLTSLDGILNAPSLRELLLIRKINVSPADVDRIRHHPTLQHFTWFAEDVPNKVWCPVVESIELPPVQLAQFAAEWFKTKRSPG